MTHRSDSAVNLERLAQLLDAYGGDSARWPEHERAAALQLIAASPEAQVLHRAALDLDNALDLSVLPEVASSALRARVLEIPIKHPAAARSGWGFNWNWKLALFALTPFVRPNCTANSAVFATPTSTPPFATNDSRFASPCQPSPGRMSSVCASVLMFGVSGEFFHGTGFRHMGIP